MAASRPRASLDLAGGGTHGRLEERSDAGLYLYFATPRRPAEPLVHDDGVRPVYDEATDPDPAGAFSRWMANRDRVVAANAAALRGTQRPVARPGPEPELAR